MNAMKTLLAGAALALSTAGANAATVYATNVIDHNPGVCLSNVATCTANNRDIVGNAVDNDASTFYSLGLGGNLTVGFGGTTFYPDHHVKVTEITFSSIGANPPSDEHFEAVEVFAVLNDSVLKSLGILYNWGTTSLIADVAFNAIKLVDVTQQEFTDKGIYTASFDGFDVSSVGIAPVPLPAAGAMLLAGLGGFATLRRRKQAA